MTLCAGAGWHYRIYLHVERGVSPHIALHLCLPAEGCPEQVQKYLWILLELFPWGGLKRDLWKLGLSPALYSFAFSVLQYSILDRYGKGFIYTTGSLGFNKEAIVRWCSNSKMMLPCLGSSLGLFFHQPCFIIVTLSLQFGLLSEPVPPPAMRSLVMIAKCLQVKSYLEVGTFIIELFQNLANLVEFGGKEPYMEVPP